MKCSAEIGLWDNVHCIRKHESPATISRLILLLKFVGSHAFDDGCPLAVSYATLTPELEIFPFYNMTVSLASLKLQKQ